MASIIVILLILVTFCAAKWYVNYKKYNELKKINNEYITLKEEIKKYEVAIEDYKLAKGEEVDNQKKLAELKAKVTKLNKEVDDYTSGINKLNKELGIK